MLEDRGAQAPLTLAPAEGFRGPSAPFGGLRPLLLGLRPLLEAYGLFQYHQWISQLEYMLFDTQHVEIGPKMAEIVQIAWKLREICVKLREGVRVKVLPMNFSARVHGFWYQTCWNWPKYGWNSPNCVKIVWKLREIAWTHAWNFLKVWPMNFLARVHAFWYPTCWNWPKNGWNSPNCVKFALNCMKRCMKLHEEVGEIAWKYHGRLSRLEYMLFDTQHVEMIPKMAEMAQIVWKLRENCVKVRERACLCQTSSKNTSNSPNRLNAP